jgi:zinc transport system permease protein
MGVGVIFLSCKRGYQPVLVSFLFGSILTVSRSSIVVIASITLVVLGFFWRYHHHVVFAAFDEEAALLSGIRVNLMLTGYHILLALVVIASIRTVGVILVNALLIIPAATVKLWAHSLAHMFVLTPLLGMACVVGGIVSSYYLDLPSGPAIVVLAGVVFLAAVSLPRPGQRRGAKGR